MQMLKEQKDDNEKEHNNLFSLNRQAVAQVADLKTEMVREVGQLGVQIVKEIGEVKTSVSGKLAKKLDLGNIAKGVGVAVGLLTILAIVIKGVL